jgi:lipooligosaccharide transport system permease protein
MNGWYRPNLSYRIFYVFLRNLISYKRFVVPTLVVSIGQPLFYLITFGVGLGAYMGAFGGKPYLHFLVPGVLVSSVMLSASFECLYGTFVKMVHERLYDSLVATPVSAEDAVAGDIAWGAFRGLIGGVLMLLVALFMGIFPASLVSVALLLVLMIFVGVLFGSMAMIITSFAPNFDFFNYYTELVLTPMLFFSGVFFPLDRFPAWMKTFADFLPLTHAVRISRAAFGGAIGGTKEAASSGGPASAYSAEAASGVLLSFLVLLAIEVAAFYIGIKRMKHRLIK